MRQREDWWEYTKKIIRSYPELKRKLESTGSPSITVTYAPVSGQNSGVSRPVERAVVERLTDKEQRRYDAVTAAIAETKRMRDGQKRLEMIEKVYWNRSHTLYGAAMCLPISERTAWRWNSRFIRLVEQKLNLP